MGRILGCSWGRILGQDVLGVLRQDVLEVLMGQSMCALPRGRVRIASRTSVTGGEALVRAPVHPFWFERQVVPFRFRVKALHDLQHGPRGAMKFSLTL